MRRRWLPFLENTAESTVACLVTMTQANLFVATTGHWIVAARTGVIAGSAAAALILLSRVRRRWVTSTILGLFTAVVDYLVHPGAFGPVFMEAAVTGLVAGLLSYGVGWVWRRVRPVGGGTATAEPRTDGGAGVLHRQAWRDGSPRTDAPGARGPRGVPGPDGWSGV